jgi:transglutaminase-like putative cysteine protease
VNNSPSPPLESTQATGVLLASVVALLPHLPLLPLWLSIGALLVVIARAFRIRTRKEPLPRRWLFPLALALLVGIVVEYHRLLGQMPGIALLVGMAALKQLEARNRRDGQVLLLLNLFVVLTVFIREQSILNTLALIAVMVLSVTALHSLFHPDAPPKILWRQCALMLAQALPLAIVLFVLFPRVSGPLWGLPRDGASAKSGLSDTMTPGNLMQLALSDEIAFRVKFEGAPPGASQLYWRGPVLSAFDGRTWRQSERQSLEPALKTSTPPLAASPKPPTILQEVTLEAHNKRWLFALETPVTSPPDTLLSPDFQLLAKRNITDRSRYTVESRTDLPLGLDEKPALLVLNTALPTQGNPRTRALGMAWRQNAGPQASAQELMDIAQRDFLSRKLQYTLDPAPLGENDIDGFLFDTGQGFCEHFAGAYVFALRAAGVPARVVTGYQGGERNPFDQVFSIRQSDAHAWAEVWSPQRGWMRVDPVAISAPRRIDVGIGGAGMDRLLPHMVTGRLPWLRDFRLRWEAANSVWSRWMISYDMQRQKDLLTPFGAPDWQGMAVWLLILCAAISSALLLWAIRPRRDRDMAQRYWRQVQHRLSAQGLGAHPWEGAHDYVRRVILRRPDLSALLIDLASAYTAVRYGGDSTQLPRLRQALLRLHP